MTKIPFLKDYADYYIYVQCKVIYMLPYFTNRSDILQRFLTLKKIPYRTMYHTYVQVFSTYITKTNFEQLYIIKIIIYRIVRFEVITKQGQAIAHNQTVIFHLPLIIYIYFFFKDIVRTITLYHQQIIIPFTNHFLELCRETLKAKI